MQSRSFRKTRGRDAGRPRVIVTALAEGKPKVHLEKMPPGCGFCIHKSALNAPTWPLHGWTPLSPGYLHLGRVHICARAGMRHILGITSCSCRFRSSGMSACLTDKEVVDD